MVSVFSSIVAGEIPCYKIAETSACLAFLDISPLQKGHVLVVPKKEVDQLFDLPEEDYRLLMDFVYRVARGLRQAMGCQRVGVSVLGFDVAHAHVHLVPMNGADDMNFRGSHLSLSADEMQDLARRIAGVIE